MMMIVMMMMMIVMAAVTSGMETLDFSRSPDPPVCHVPPCLMARDLTTCHSRDASGFNWGGVDERRCWTLRGHAHRR
eukprot:1968870-Rhodomonas_salina.1